MPELGPTTTDAELNDLLGAIDKEIELDPELTQDLLDILNDEDEEMADEEYEEPQGAAGFVGHYDYLGGDEVEFSDEGEEAEFSGNVEEDPEMAEMLKMIEEAQGDLEGKN